MRKVMQKEVVKTEVQFSTLEVIEGVPTIKTHDAKVFLGKVSEERAFKTISKEIKQTPTITAVEHKIERYEMEVERFMELAEKVEIVEKEEQTTIETYAETDPGKLHSIDDDNEEGDF